MHHHLSDFEGCALRCRASVVAGRVLKFLLDDGAWTLRYVCVQLDDDSHGVPRLLPVATLPPVSESDHDLIACLTPDELRRGHPLTGSIEGFGRSDEQALHDALHWLPYWLEPGRPAAGTLRDADRAVGAGLSCGGEPFGTVEDLLVDTETWVVSALRIATGDASGSERLYLPPSFIRDADWSARHFDTDVRAAALACAPTSSPGALPGPYFDRLLQHLADGRRMA